MKFDDRKRKNINGKKINKLYPVERMLKWKKEGWHFGWMS